MATLSLVLLIAAAVTFLLGVFGLRLPISTVALGLLFATLSVLVTRV